jgi:hypothetical protein
MSATWIAIIVATLGCFAFKLAGQSVPERVLDRPVVHEIADVLPIALLSALVVVQTFATGPELVVDARIAGVAAAVVALLLRAPFLVVVVTAAVVAAAFRAIGLAT